MPTIFSHPAVAAGLAPSFRRRISAAMILVGAVCSMLPDADVAAFGFGIPYEHPLGHRGFTHSLTFAALFAGFAAFAYLRLSRSALGFRRTFAYFFGCLVSHGLLDAMTDGGKGVGFFIPFSSGRYFFTFRPIHVSPLGASDFVERATLVLLSEIRWVWLPSLLLGLIGWALHRAKLH